MAQHRNRAGGKQPVFVAALAGPARASLPPLEFCRGVIPSQAATLALIGMEKDRRPSRRSIVGRNELQFARLCGECPRRLTGEADP